MNVILKLEMTFLSHVNLNSNEYLSTFEKIYKHSWINFPKNSEFYE